MGISKAIQLYTQLKEQILRNELKPNEFLSENRICEQYHVSRTPVHQALQELIRMGFANAIPNKGVFVSELHIIDAIEIYRLREVLDPVAIEICMQDESVAVIAGMQDSLNLQKQYIAAGDYQMYLRADLDFHRCYLNNCPNQRLKTFLTQLSDDSMRFSSYARDDQMRAGMSIEQHEKILDAMQKCDIEAAKKAARDHMIEVREYFKRRL